MNENELLEQEMTERQRIEIQIACLQQKLSEPTSDIGDWKIIKIYEARLQNRPDPYNYEEYYGVEIEKVLPSKYSFTVIKEAQFMSGSQDVSYNKMEVKDGRRTQD